MATDNAADEHEKLKAAVGKLREKARDRWRRGCTDPVAMSLVDYFRMTNNDLTTLCREHGIKVEDVGSS